MVRLILFLSMLFSCESRSEVDILFPYSMSAPASKIILPEELREVSGITFTKGEQNMVCIEDNIGILWHIDPTEGKVINKEQFEGKGDFEDLAITESAIFILRSDGTLFEKKEDKVTKHNSFLTAANNAEAMCYDKKNSRLLILLKDQSVAGKDSEKECYAFDLKSRRFLDSPVFTITYKDFRQFIKDNKNKFKFKPSAMAIHPISGELYIISGTARAIAVTDLNGNIKSVRQLSKELFAQPEGICFDKNASMYISNEGRKGEPDILIFKQL